MNNSTLASLYRCGARDGIAAEDVARLAAGEHLGARHAAAVEALAESAAARRAWLVAGALKAEIEELPAALAQARRVVALPPRRPVALRQLLPYAAAAGLVAAAVALGTLRQAGEVPAARPSAHAQPTAGAVEDDLISRLSWEDGAVATVSAPGETIFVDEFGLPGGS